MTDHPTAPDAFEEFKWRGMLYDHTEGAEAALKGGKVTAYIGFDPTAASLHVGHLVAIMGLVHLQRHGHTPIALVGGGTGFIGDPSGKSKERNLLTVEQLAINVEGIRGQLERFLHFEDVPNPAVMGNNADWLLNLNLIAFLRDTGKHFTVNYMMAKDSVKARLASEEGISYTEFTYMLLQAFDFLELHRRHGCTFQMGGSDQWGNITAGTQLIKRITGTEAYGVVYPLLTTSSGTKFGKTEGGAVWLDAALTSPYKFYQFWLNTDDADVIKNLKLFTLFGPERIAALEESVRSDPARRETQRTLAQEVTRRVHGEAALAAAEAASQVLFGGSLEGLTAADLLDIFAEVPSTALPAGRLMAEGGLPLVEAVSLAGFENSNKRARQLIESGGLYVNGQRAEDPSAALTREQSIEGQVIVLRKGRKQYHLIRIEAE